MRYSVCVCVCTKRSVRHTFVNILLFGIIFRLDFQFSKRENNKFLIWKNDISKRLFDK